MDKLRQNVEDVSLRAAVSDADDSEMAGEAVRAASRFRRVGFSAVAGIVARIIVVACNLTMVPVLIAFLGPTQFGIWAAYQSIQTLLVFADFGIGNGMQNAVTVAIAKGDVSRAQSLISNAFVALVAAAALLGLIAIAAFNSSFVGSWFSSTHQQDGGFPALWAGVAVFVGAGLLAIPLSCGERIALAMQLGFVTQSTRALATVLAFGVVLMLVKAQASFAAICLATSMPVLVGPLLAWIAVSWTRAWAMPATASVTGRDVLAVLRSGAGFLAVQLTAIFGFGLDTILIERYAGPVEVANYSVVQRLYALVPMITGIALAPLWPAYADARARGDYAWARSTFLRSLIATGGVAGACSLAIALSSARIMTVWLGNAVTPPAILVMAHAGLSLVLACGMAFSYFWNGMHMLRLQALLGVIFVVISLPLKFLTLADWGATGVVVINAAVYSLASLIPGAIATSSSLRQSRRVTFPQSVVAAQSIKCL